tara:strand:- start:15401 stop:16714 length:1314 start_codon:yes stop_codon:yes gene_type:complete
MINKVQQFIAENNLCKKEDRILLAISGGADSICLFFILKELGYYFEIAHCNFQLRAKESDDDEKFVRLLAEKYSVKIHVKNFQTEKYSRKNKISIQMAARHLRYTWFDELLSNNKNQLDYVATAHHQDDSIETFFINLIRGSGINGLVGIREKFNLIIRPLLNISRDEIEVYLREKDQVFRSDSSNNDLKYLRNKIRLHLVPLLKEMNPKIKEVISDEISILTSVSKIFQEQVQSKREELIRRKDGVYQINILDLLKLNHLEVYLFEILKPFNFKEVKQIIRAFNSQSGKIFFSGTHQLIIDRERILISDVEKEGLVIEISETDLNISDPLNFNFSVSENTKIINDSKIAKLDFDKLSFPLTLRKWCDGDRFKPFGMGNFKKLSDFFIDEKYSIFDKKKQWILCSGDDIVWIVGKRIDDRYKIDTKTKKVYIAKLLN